MVKIDKIPKHFKQRYLLSDFGLVDEEVSLFAHSMNIHLTRLFERFCIAYAAPKTKNGQLGYHPVLETRSAA